MSPQKLGLELRGRDHTGFLFSEPLVAIAGHKIVNGIPNGFGNPCKYGQKGVPPTKALANFQCGIRFGIVGHTGFNKENGIHLGCINAPLFDHLLTHFTLQRRITEHILSIPFDHKLDRTVA